LTLLPFLLLLLRPTAPPVGCSNEQAKLHMNSQLMLLFFFPPSAFASVKIQQKLVSFYFLISPDFIVFSPVLNAKFHHLVHVVLTLLRMYSQYLLAIGRGILLSYSDNHLATFVG